MKKGRPGWVLAVLCVPHQDQEMIRHIFAHTTTNGLRAHLSEKFYLASGREEVQTQWGPVGAKRAQGFGVSRVKPEYEDAAALARANGLSYQTVCQEVLRRIEE